MSHTRSGLGLATVPLEASTRGFKVRRARADPSRMRRVLVLGLVIVRLGAADVICDSTTDKGPSGTRRI